jgi:RHS repeat-associated protein
MKRLAIVVGFLTALFAVSVNVSAASPILLRSQKAPQQVHPQIFHPGPANRMAVGGAPHGRFALSSPNTGEVVGLRTRTARTYQTGDGNYATVLGIDPVNYRDATGAWQPIDDSLVTTNNGLSFRNKANQYVVEVPTRLEAGTVRITNGGATIGFALVGASGTASVNANSVTYSNALAGVSQQLTALTDRVKENLVLVDSLAPSSFTFRVELPAHVSARTASGQIDFMTSDGQILFSFAAPFMYDRNGTRSSAVSQRLEKRGDSVVLVLSADRAWLASPQRQWPVVIDPTVTFQGTTQDCFITGASSASTRVCGGTTLNVGYDGTQASRALLQFDLSSIPANVQVLNAELRLVAIAASTANTTPMSLHQVTQGWTNSATWNTADGTTPWGTVGGSFVTTPSVTVNGVGAAAAYSWYPTQLMQAWVNGSAANSGLLLKETTENVVNVLQFCSSESSTNSQCFYQPPPPPSAVRSRFLPALNPTPPPCGSCQTGYNWAPKLTVAYQPWTGKQRFFTFGSHTLTDRMDLGVNVANGNVLLHAKDFSIRGTGLDLALERWYNNQGDIKSTLGTNWLFGTGRDVGLVIYGDGSAAYFGPSGYQIPFIRNSDGSFTPPTGIDATLIKNGDGTYSFSANKNGTKQNFSSGGFLTSQADQNGNRISFAYNADNTLGSITDTQGRVTTFTYVTGLLTSVTDPAARSYQYGYDTNNRVATYTDPAGKMTQFSYDTPTSRCPVTDMGCGRVGSNVNQIIDPNGNITKLSYDSSGRVVSITYVTNPAAGTGSVESYAYNPGNTVVTDPNGNKTTYYYDVQARVTKTVDALGNTSTITYTANSDPAQTTTSTSQNNYTYDGMNNATAVSGAGLSKSAAYGDASHPYYPTRQTTAEGSGVTYTYSVAGNVVQRTDPTGHSTTYTYNSNGTLASATDANGNSMSWQYDAYGNLTQATYPAPIGVETFTYDSLGRMASRTDGRGLKTTFSYDALDRLTLTTYADGSAVSASYDGDGNAVSSTDPTGTETRTYDALNRLNRQTFPTSQSISYSWDGNGNLTSETDAGGTLTQQFDAINRPSAIIDRAGGKTTLFGNVAAGTQSWTYPNGVTETLTFNSAQQITKIAATNVSGAVLLSQSYSYLNPATGLATTERYSMMDAAGNVTQYSYDLLARLTAATKRSSSGTVLGSYQYGYDPVGNITAETLNGSTTTMSYNGANELTQAGGSSFTFDAAGNELGNSAGLSLAYNAAGQTTSITPPGGSAMTMKYSGTGQTNRVQGGPTSYQYDLGGIGSLTNSGASSYFVKLPNGFPLSEKTATGTYYYLHDALGSVLGLTDAVGSIVNRYDYDPYGNTVTATEGVTNPFRWIGGVWDAATSLYKLGARYYSPALGRFTQIDPAHQCTNGYAYAGDNPINLSDPTGEFWWNCGVSFAWAWGFGWWWAQTVAWCFFDFNKFDIALIGFLAGRGVFLLGLTGPWGWVAAVAIWAVFYWLANAGIPLGFWVSVGVYAGAYWQAWPWTFQTWSGFWIGGGRNTWCTAPVWAPWAWCR